MLEMVLALPILLFVMALMVNFGTAAVWKVRGLIVARHTAWASRWPRTPHAFPPPVGSIGIADFAIAPPDHAQDLDNVPALHRPVARGPLPLGNRVDAELLNCNRGLRSGRATVVREFPLLSKKIGPYRLEPHTEVLGDPWQFDDMGLRHNGERRIPVIYDLVKAPAFLSRAYFNAAKSILNPQLQSALRPLDHDDDFFAYGGTAAPDFHPTLGALCTRNLAAVRQAADLLEKRISDVPETLAREFKELYERALQAGRDDSALQAKIQALEDFLQTLQQSEDNN